MSDAPHPEFRLAVVGAGSWGTTLAGLAAGAAGGESGGPTVLWAREPEVADSVNHAHVNPLFLSNHRLPATLRATTSIPEVLDAARRGDHGRALAVLPVRLPRGRPPA